MRTITRFRFPAHPDRGLVDDDLAMAVLAAEALFGAARLRLEASYLASDVGATCLIESRGEAGDALARVFARLCAVRVGEAGFLIEPVDGEASLPAAEPVGARR
jgi:hypothetical protein